MQLSASVCLSACCHCSSFLASSQLVPKNGGGRGIYLRVPHYRLTTNFYLLSPLNSHSFIFFFCFSPPFLMDVVPSFLCGSERFNSTNPSGFNLVSWKWLIWIMRRAKLRLRTMHATIGTLVFRYWEGQSLWYFLLFSFVFFSFNRLWALACLCWSSDLSSIAWECGYLFSAGSPRTACPFSSLLASQIS